MDEQEKQRLSSFLTTEHFTLQGAKSSNISETGNRVSAYLGVLSGVLIALAFVAQISGAGQIFIIFVLILFPILITIGAFTYVRILQLTIANAIYTMAINRIRRFYLDVAPHGEQYLSFPGYDDNHSLDRTMLNFVGFRTQVLVSDPMQITLLNSFFVGLFFGILCSALFTLPLWILLLIGVAAFLIAFGIHLRVALAIDNKTRKEMEPRFPAPTPTT